MSTTKDIAIQLSLAIASGDWARAEALLADDFQYVGDGRPALDKAQYLHFMRHVLCSGMADMQLEFSRTVAEGPLVALEYTNTMTHRGTFLGVAATGRRVVASGHLIREVRAGQVAREWQTTNAAGLMAQLCAPAQPQQSGGDHA